MTRRDPRSTTERGYGWQYQQARARLLINNPPCHWCSEPATTADHEPPLHTVSDPSLWAGVLLPACQPCNSGRSSGTIRYGPYGRMSGPRRNSQEW